MNGKLSIIIIMSVILVTAAILTLQSSSSSLSMLQPSYAQLCPDGSTPDASGNCPTLPPPAGDGETAQAPPPAGDGETAQAPPPPATTETPPPPAAEAPPPATTETPPPPAAEIPPPPATTETPPPPAAQAPPPANASQVSNNTGSMSADWINSILAVHNSERAAVGVPPLVWNNSLAAGAQAWAEHIVTTGIWTHASSGGIFGENIAGFDWSAGPTAPGGGTALWVDEKQNYHGQLLTEENFAPIGHYTQMVWRNSQEVGCGAAPPGAGVFANNIPFSILVCRYIPTGNYVGEAPY